MGTGGRSGAAAPAPGPVHVTPRGRRVAVTAALLVAGAVGFLGGRADAAAVDALGPVVEVAVAPGDTLWSLAGQVLEEGEDRRDVIREIQRINALSSAEIVAGTVLLLPVTPGS